MAPLVGCTARQFKLFAKYSGETPPADILGSQVTLVRVKAIVESSLDKRQIEYVAADLS